MKRKMIHELHPGRSREIMAWIGIITYIVLSTMSLLYPMTWYIYIWIYQHMLTAEQDLDLIADGDPFSQLSAQNLFIWIIGGLYCFVSMIAMIAVIVHICTGEMRETITKLMAVVFVWSVRAPVGFQSANLLLSDARHLERKLLIVQAICKNLDCDVALIVLDYLY